jgi:hypothetical protein
MKKLFVYHSSHYQPFNRKCVFTRLGTLYNSLLSDRFNFLNRYSQWNIEKFDDPLPKINTNLDYKEICLNKATELSNQYPDGIALAYSGGIDSIGMVASLVQVGYPSNKIHIIGNRHSINENVSAFDYLKKHNFKLRICKDNVFMAHFDNLPEPVILTGHCNDQFFHVGTVYENLDKQLIPLQDSLKWMYTSRNLLEYLEFDLYLVAEYSKLIGWEVRDMFDLSVLLNFGCRYKFIQSHLAIQTTNLETSYKFANFYDNQDFQDWAFTNREVTKEYYKKSLTDNTYYKKCLKELIYPVFGKTDEIEKKGKEGSWGKRILDLSIKRTLPIIYGVLDSNGYKVKWYPPAVTADQDFIKRERLFKAFFKDYIREDYYATEYK